VYGAKQAVASPVTGDVVDSTVGSHSRIGVAWLLNPDARVVAGWRAGGGAGVGGGWVGVGVVVEALSGAGEVDGAVVEPEWTVVVVVLEGWAGWLPAAPAAATPMTDPDAVAMAKTAALATTCRRIRAPPKSPLPRASVTSTRRPMGAARATATRSSALSVNSASGYSTTSSGTENDARHNKPLLCRPSVSPPDAG
jgi:hypothetical protein